MRQALVAMVLMMVLTVAAQGAEMQDVGVAPGSEVVGATTGYVFTFDLTNAWLEPTSLPGTLVIIFPKGYDVTGAGDEPDPPSSGGSRTATVTGCGSGNLPNYPVASTGNADAPQLTISQVGTLCEAGDPIIVTVSNIKNPGVSGNNPITVKTMDGANPTNTGTVDVTIEPGALTGLSAARTGAMGGVGTITLGFKPANTWPSGGRFVATFPTVTGYDLTDVALGTMSGCTVTGLMLEGNKLTATNAVTNCVLATSITLEGIKNPLPHGPQRTRSPCRRRTRPLYQSTKDKQPCQPSMPGP